MSTPVDIVGSQAPANGFGPARIFQLLLGVLLLMCGAWLIWDFPYARLWLLGLAVLLAVAQWRDARAWLVAVPALFALVDLGVWSGRFLFSEQDALLAVLVGVALVAGQYGNCGRQLVRGAFVPLWLLAIALTVGVARGLAPVPELNANAWNGYLTGWNAVRVAKGPLWALVFWPLLARQLEEDQRTTETRLVLGMAAALIGFGAFVLWERGLASDLISANNFWGLFSTWLNLSGSYRITGPFSQMQLGGEAVDGFLALTWPFAFLLLFQARRWPLILVAALALALAAYGVMVTFTRTTYAAIAVAFVAFGVAALSGASAGHRFRLALVALYMAIAAAVFVYGFRLGGTLTTIGYLVVVLGTLSAGMFIPARLPRAIAAVGVPILLAAGAYVALHGMTTSKWSGVDPRTAGLAAAASTLLLGIGGGALGIALRPWSRTRTAAALLLSVAVLLPMATLSLSGFQIEKRFSLVNRDLDYRLAHWRRTVAILPHDVWTAALGLGLGRFPIEALLAAEEPTGTWHFDQDGSRTFLRLLGTASLCYGQRVQGLEPGTYRLEVVVRNPSKLQANLAVKLQPRHLLESELWQPETRQVNFVVEPGSSGWQRLEGDLHLHAGAVPPWHDPRFAVFALTNQGHARSAVDVASVRLIDRTGRDRLDNGNFAAGGDRWFAYNDFQHLEWHPKSFYVAVFFDMGWLGVAAFAVVFLAALYQSWRKARSGSAFGAATTAAMIGFLALGTTGTLLDVPQLMTLLMLVVIAATWRPKLPRP